MFKIILEKKIYFMRINLTAFTYVAISFKLCSTICLGLGLLTIVNRKGMGLCQLNNLLWNSTC